MEWANNVARCGLSRDYHLEKTKLSPRQRDKTRAANVESFAERPR